MGFIYNGISSKNMKIKARLTSWQASPALRNSYEMVLVVIAQSESLSLIVMYTHKKVLLSW